MSSSSGIFHQTKIEAFLRFVRSPFKAFFYFAAKLPAAWLAGVRVQALSTEECTTSVPFRWLSQNPFRSTYFACLAMAGELSNGLLAMLYVQAAPRRVSMLVVHVAATFHKKAVSRTTFHCADGQRIADAIAQTISTGQPVTLVTQAEGHSDNGTPIASFIITWSFKAAAP
ncbi:protein of unknown function [Chitinophaga costaii]|uniref:Acyl-coenzyme A thioesterase PaaI, contains HGG motif n=1 Tax=Chitinophaga costaii TaxID=1335309 RepID=A0A1C4F1L1_9BACT|nr:DUF4442 domain-containing protein [Chitinophaga costaii]PUZ22156.1 thioesterase [Chitinophaga costaii]SCC49662.1 protein of unknown function [Chitinophaga costaii]